MPSPLSHIVMGYVIYKTYHDQVTENNKEKIWKFTSSLLFILMLSLLPDFDSIVGILSGQFGRYHNNFTHSLLFGLPVALIAAALVGWKRKSSFTIWFLISLTAYEMHVIMDFFTVGRGVMLFWPFSTTRFASPLKLFYGLHWSDGLISVRHLWTLVTEIGFFLLLLIPFNLFKRLKSRSTP